VGAGREGKLFLLGVLSSSPRRSATRLSGCRQPDGEARGVDALHRIHDGGRYRTGGAAVFPARACLGAAASRTVWGYAVVLATFSTVLPVFLQSEALKRIGATHFALIGAVGPVSVAVTSALGLDEPFTWLQAAGGALVIIGVLLVSLKPKS